MIALRAELDAEITNSGSQVGYPHQIRSLLHWGEPIGTTYEYICTYIDTYIHTDTACVPHVNVGLAHAPICVRISRKSFRMSVQMKKTLSNLAESRNFSDLTILSAA